jgi:hypothetical protein
MKIIEMDKNEKKINIKKLTIVVSITIMILIGAILFIIYCANEEFRNLVDKYVLMKNVVEDGTATISIDEDESNYIFAYDKYISILNKNILSNYNSLGNLDSELDVEITTPIVATNGKYLVIAEKNQSKIYLISGSQ